jgi:NAD(P)-dependent dehydrogenase (short-subunit alcohol dehydrogenase family)
MTVLVTGAGGAMGRAVAARLLARGEAVVAHDLDDGALSALVARGAQPLTGNLLEDATLARLSGRSPLAGVVAAHGVPGAGSLADLEPDQVRHILAVNAASVVRLFAAVEPALAGAGGAFVAIASQAGLVGEPDNAAYCASKYAVVGWARALAPAAARRGVRLRVLCPGRTRSPLLHAGHARFAAARGLSLEEFEERQRERVPAGRFADPDEMAAAAEYLLDARGPGPVVLAVTGGEVPW